jgi:protein-tyrosine phosphatase
VLGSLNVRSAAPQWLRTLARFARSASARHDARHELRRRLRGEPSLPEGPLHRVLVLCHGNICRSPFAAALLSTRLPTCEVRSAGLHAGEGNPADPLAVKCADRLGVSLAGHRSARVDSEMLAWADLILVMQGAHAAAIEPPRRSRVRLLGDYLPAPPFLLQDPWGQEERVFDQVFERLSIAVENLAVRIETRRSQSPPRSAD